MEDFKALENVDSVEEAYFYARIFKEILQQPIWQDINLDSLYTYMKLNLDMLKNDIKKNTPPFANNALHELFNLMQEVYKRYALNKKNLLWIANDDICCAWVWCNLKYSFHLTDWASYMYFSWPVQQYLIDVKKQPPLIQYSTVEKIKYLNKENGRLSFISDKTAEPTEQYNHIISYLNMTYCDLSSRQLIYQLQGQFIFKLELPSYDSGTMFSKEVRNQKLQQLKRTWYEIYSKNMGVIIDWDFKDKALSSWVWEKLNKYFDQEPSEFLMPLNSKQQFISTQAYLNFILQKEIPKKEDPSELINKLKIGITQVTRRENERGQKTEKSINIRLDKAYQAKLSNIGKKYNKRGNTSTLEFIIDAEISSENHIIRLTKKQQQTFDDLCAHNSNGEGELPSRNAIVDILLEIYYDKTTR